MKVTTSLERIPFGVRDTETSAEPSLADEHKGPQGSSHAHAHRDEAELPDGATDWTWSLSAVIPSECLAAALSSESESSRAHDARSHVHVDLLAPRSALRGNFYKCGDKLPQPHWLSAFPIDTDIPNFHRPDCFRRLVPDPDP